MTRVLTEDQILALQVLVVDLKRAIAEDDRRGRRYSPLESVVRDGLRVLEEVAT